MTVEIIRQITMTGCRRSEMIGLSWSEVDAQASCLRLEDSKEGYSIRPIGLPVVEYLEERAKSRIGTYVFPGNDEDRAFGSFPITGRSSRDSPLAMSLPTFFAMARA